jgi:hypothetical protein
VNTAVLFPSLSSSCSISITLIICSPSTYSLFSLKTEDDCERFLRIVESKVEKKNFIIVRDFTSPQRKYLYDLLVIYSILIIIL